MPRSNTLSRHSPTNSNGSSDLLPFLDPAPTGNLNQTSGKAKVLSGSQLNSNGKRNCPSSSGDSSGSDIAEEDEEGSESTADDEDEDDDEPGSFAPSYSKKSTKSYKAGTPNMSSPTASRKKMKFDDDGYEGQASDGGSDSDSSDDGYEGVDDITDEDDEEQDVEKLEEQMIVESERSRRPTNTFSNTNTYDIADQWSDFGALDGHLLFSNADFFDQDQYFARYDQPTQASGGVESEAETPTRRRVHFEERNDSSDNDKTPTPSSDDEDDDEIPSDFLQQDCLDPDLRRMIENDIDVNQRNQNRYDDDLFADSYEQHTGNIYHVDTEPVSDGSSGYETDDGETTDEDLPPPATITHPRTLLRRDSSVSLTPESDGFSRQSQPPRRRGPVLGTFVADPNKPVAVVDCTGQRLVIIPAYASSRHDWLASATASMSGTTDNSPRATTMHVIDESESDALISPTRTNYSPMMSSSANLMMTAVGNDTRAGGQVMGPPEAFYPSNSFSADGGYEEDDEDDDEDDDGEDVLNVDDFIDFGNGSSDEELDKDFETDEPTSPVLASPLQPNTTPITARHDDANHRTSAERFLDHLDQGVVTAFRRNHTRYQTLIRLPQHREFMPANSPSRPASVFRHAKASDPKHSRKRKSSTYMGGEAVRRKLMDTHRRNNLSI
ncbi:hypothetical protein FQN54_001728 [Arachnomyces sp. PD_36]|nr:hypothetical protein FQN54_001728 [Arachnomyces sp. PD_36]